MYSDFSIVLAIAIGLYCVVFYARPVGQGKKAHLVLAAEESAKAQKLVDGVVAKTYLSFWEYDAMLKLVERIISLERSDAILAESRARNETHRASNN